MTVAIRRARWSVPLAFVASVVLASCAKPPTVGERDIAGEALPVSQFWSVPPGVDVTAEEFGRAELDGLFASSRGYDATCCWMAPQARVRFRKARAATRLTMTVYVAPNVPLYRRKPPFVRVALDGVTLVSKDALPVGPSKLEMTLPTRYRDGVGPYVLEVRTSSFVPAREHINADSRVLGLMLRNIETR